MDAEGDDYEAIRQRNIAANKALLLSLGFDQVSIPQAAPKLPNTKPKVKAKPKKRVVAEPKSSAKRKASDELDGNSQETLVEDADEPSSKRAKRDGSSPTAADSSEETPSRMTTRRSSRATKRLDYSNDGISNTVSASRSAKSGKKGSAQTYDGELDLDLVDETKLRQVPKIGERAHNPKSYGHIPGIEVGTWFESRPLCSKAAIHAPYVAGIFGDKDNGAYSIALSGGYADDVDLGEAFTYTGAGGRDLKGTKQNPKNLRTAPQSTDQSFEHKLNSTLLASVTSQNPVRVIRGFKCPSVYAPRSGYRYDGLYHVTKAWMDEGMEGFKVCKYALTRLPGQPPLLTKDDSDDEEEGDAESEGDEEAEAEE